MLSFTELVKTAPQQKPKISQNPTVQWHVCNSPRLVHILIYVNPTYDFLPRFLKTCFNAIIQSRLYSANGLFHSGWPTKILYEFLYSTLRTTCSTHVVIFLALITE